MVPNGRAFLAVLSAVTLGITGASCAGGGEEPPLQNEDPPSVGSCIGPIPENATLCPGTDTGLSADAPRVVKPYCQTTPCSYVCNDGYVVVDGGCQPVSPPAAILFVDNGDGTVSMTDGFGTIVWLRNAHCLETLAGVDRGEGPVLWAEAKAWTAGLASGACGLTDGSGPGDWQLPGQTGLQRLAADLASLGADAWNLFSGIQETAYWSDFSTCTGIQGAVVIGTGQYDDVNENSHYDVWPARR